MKPRQGDKVIVLIGKTGVGKSTFICEATGKKQKSTEPNSLGACTKAVEFVRANLPVGRPPVVFMDTPGFDAGSDETTLGEISQELQQLYRAKIDIAGILYLCRISDNRFNKSSIETLKLVKNLCGQQALSNLVVVTTMWSELPDKEKGKGRERQIKDDFCQQILGERQMARFDRGSQSAWSIVNPLLTMSPASPLAIQTELEDDKLPIHKTTAAIQQQKSKRAIPAHLLSKLRKVFKRH